MSKWAGLTPKASLSQRANRLTQFFADPPYFRALFKIALPISLQYLVTNSLNMVGVIMIGQLGETSVAAVGLASQIFFLLSLLLFGITSGSAIFTAQMWGRRDISNIHKVLGLCLAMGLTAGLIFWAVAVLVPEKALGLYTNDPAVIALGSEYLRIYGWAYIFVAITFSYAAVLRSTGEVRIPLVVSMAALSFNTLLSYGLIFGKFGLPELGVRGAALAALIARILECSAILWISYRSRTPAAARLQELFGFDRLFAKKVLNPVLPVVFNELLWSLGITTYNAIYAHISTDAIAAMNIVGSIDGVAFVIFLGTSHACAILVGNQIGANEEDKAFRYGARTLVLVIALAVLMGGLVILLADDILTLYKVSAGVILYAQKVLTIIGLLFWLRASNLLLLIGVFRSGGDTRYAFFLDAGVIWLVGVPMALIGAFVLHLPVYGVYLMIMTEELVRALLCFPRFISRKWIHNLVQTV
jgi:putative MATE family efflux protein